VSFTHVYYFETDIQRNKEQHTNLLFLHGTVAASQIFVPVTHQLISSCRAEIRAVFACIGTTCSALYQGCVCTHRYYLLSPYQGCVCMHWYYLLSPVSGLCLHAPVVLAQPCTRAVFARTSSTCSALYQGCVCTHQYYLLSPVSGLCLHAPVLLAQPCIRAVFACTGTTCSALYQGCVCTHWYYLLSPVITATVQLISHHFQLIWVSWWRCSGIQRAFPSLSSGPLSSNECRSLLSKTMAPKRSHPESLAHRESDPSPLQCSPCHNATPRVVLMGILCPSTIQPRPCASPNHWRSMLKENSFNVITKWKLRCAGGWKPEPWSILCRNSTAATLLRQMSQLLWWSCWEMASILKKQIRV
jgi:hypothetical protein